MTGNLPTLYVARQVAKAESRSNSLIGRGLSSIQSGAYTLAIADRDALYRKARDDYDRITEDGSSSGWGDIWTPEELVQLRSAFEVFQRLADAGYGKAYFPLFLFHEGGQGIAEDTERACYYAKMAFDWCYSIQLQNDPEVWNDLGTLYRLGRRTECAVLSDDDTFFRFGDAAESDQEQAVFWYRQAAEAGFPPAMFNLCGMYEFGYGVEEDAEEALSWQFMAARSGHIHAQYGLGVQHQHGCEPVEQDGKQAFYWYLQAAERGHRKALISVAKMSWDGYGFPEQDELAFDWYRKQAEQGQIWAQWFLGEAYLYGRGIGNDDDKATYWYQQAAQQGEPKAQYELGWLLFSVSVEAADEAWHWIEAASDQGFGPAQHLRAVQQEDLTEDARKNLIDQAVAWYIERVEQGDAERQYEYALMILRGEIPHASRSLGLYWLRKSAEQEHKLACSDLGRNLLRDSAKEETTREAILWLEHAADLGSTGACKTLADLYLLGNSGSIREKPPLPTLIEPDCRLAVEWYERGIVLGWTTMAFDLGRLYLDGKHLSQNLGLAEKWLLHAANAGHSLAPLELGKEYAGGLHLTRNASQAIHWLAKASERLTSTGLILGKIYLECDLVARDFKKAIQWLTHAAECGTFRVDAMKIVEAFRADGSLSAIEETEAKKWLINQAALAVDAIEDSNYLIAANRTCSLAEIYELGLGVEPDLQLAIWYYTEAAESGLSKAEKRLHELGIDSDNP